VAIAIAGDDAPAVPETKRIMTSRLSVPVLIVAALAGGCVVGPDYKKPVLPTPETIRGAQTPAAAQPTLADATLWDVFQDEQLQALLRTALAQNDDLKLAAARVLEAQAQFGITRADQYPTVGAEVQAGGGRTAAIGSNPAVTAGALRVGGTVDWALDFWGRYRRATESARAQLLSTEWGRRAVLTTVVSDVANAYFELRSLDLQLEISQRTLTSRKESLQLTQVRESGGVTSLLDVREAEQLVFGAGAVIADLQRRIGQQENLINLLLGGFPSTVTRGRELVDQPHQPDLPSGLSSSLLERRPDIQAAEQQLISANAEIGVARAAYFPSISLTGSGGVQSTALGSLFSAGAGYWTAILSAAQPVFTAGRTRSQVALARARRQEATVAYAQTVKQAFREASDSLIGYSKAREFREQQESLTTAAQDARRLADIRYQGGATSYLEVLDADTRLFTAELSLAQARQGELAAFVEVYRALGGGWQQEGLPARATPPTNSQESKK
jgi:outer membrane protein, multidrug efflux system